jgi:arylformamidase
MKSKIDYFDISPLLSVKTAVFPGDVPLTRDVALDFTKGHHLLLSSLKASVHLGAHADAPNHYSASGPGIHERDLSFYMGPCQVITVKVARGERVLLKHLATTEILAPRVLVRTLSFPDPENWNSDFCSLSPELIEYFNKNKVCLVGIDTPSVDPEDSKYLETHQAIFKADMAILEGLVLDDVPDGLYTLVALPLRLKDFDASPVRAILLRHSSALIV